MALAEGSGYVAIYRSTNDAPGHLLGASDLLTTGWHDAVRVILTEPLADSTPVFVILHGEHSGNLSLDYPGPDRPLEAGGSVIAEIVTVDVEG